MKKEKKLTIKDIGKDCYDWDCIEDNYLDPELVAIDDLKKLHKQMKEELIENIPLSATPYTKEMVIKTIKQIMKERCGI